MECQNGKTTLQKKVPDTITSWIITGFAIDPITGFGMTETSRKLEVFQPFFVSTNLPYSIKRGEVVAIPIVVFNYMNQDVTAEVTLDNAGLEFDFAELTNEVDKPKVELYRSKKVSVKANNGATVSFMVKPKKVGHITIKVTAISPLAGDALERQLLVVPEGITQYANKGFFVDLRETSDFSTEVTLDIPKNAIPDSTKVEFSVVGDILGPTIQNLDKLIKLPSGCGEQNMLNFVPNIVILDYLTATNQVTQAIKSKSLDFMQKGYQRELTYKHDDGSYSAFGKSDTSGSTWLTAFVAKSFRQAENYIDIDEKVIHEALDWLANQQAQNGSFQEVGKVSHKDMQGGSGDGIALTAYVLTTFLQSKKDTDRYRNVVNKAVDYLVKNTGEGDDVYPLAVTAYAVQLAEHSSRNGILQTLQTKAKSANGLVWWEKEVVETEKKNPFYSHEPRSVNVEMTAYALLAYLEAGLTADSIPILKWLIGQRNENGGFSSTQDTVVGIGALAKIGGQLAVPNPNVKFIAKYDDEEATLNLNNDNSAILQSRELPSSVRKVNVTASGRGVGLAQISYKYNINVTGPWPRFNLDPQVTKKSTQDYLQLTTCSSYVPNAESNDLKSNMAVMEISLPSGFTADRDTLPSLEKTGGVQKVETKDGDTVIVLYFDNLDSNELCPTVSAYRTHKVANQKPAPVTLYDYYDNSRRARSFYQVAESTLCDICEGDDCGTSCSPKTAGQVQNPAEPSAASKVDKFLTGIFLITFAALLRNF